MKLEKEVSRLPDSAVRLSVTVSKEDVAENYNKLLQKYAKDIRLPGFRKGKVPAAVIERKFKDEITQEMTGGIINDALNQILTEADSQDIRPLPYMEPKLEGDQLPVYTEGEDLKFQVVYDVFPKVEVKNFSGIEVKVPDVQIGQQEIDDELKAIQERNAVVLDKKEGESATSGDIVSVDFHETDEAEKIIAGSGKEDFVFTLGSNEDFYGLGDNIVGMKKGESKLLEKNWAEDFADKSLAGQTKKIALTVKSLKVKTLPELDDELAQDVSDKYKTIEDLKADVKTRLEAAKDARIEEIKRKSLLSQLVEKNPIEVPKSMIEAGKQAQTRMIAGQYGISEDVAHQLIETSTEDAKKEFDRSAAETIKKQLVTDALIKERNISASEDDITSEIAQIALENGVATEDISDRYKESDAREFLVNRVQEKKLFAELYKQVKVVTGDKVKFADLFKDES